VVEFVRLFHDQHDRLLSFEHEVPEFSLTKLGLFGDLQLPGGQETRQSKTYLTVDNLTGFYARTSRSAKHD
jgi:hypothetical protein